VCPAIDFEPIIENNEALKELKKFSTPEQKTISDLEKMTGVPAKQLVKTLFFSAQTESDIKKNEIKSGFIR
jgi:prolyl-tRNA synthetase